MGVGYEAAQSKNTTTWQAVSTIYLLVRAISKKA